MCKFCGVEFCDVTKRNLKNTCSDECDTKLMVRTRRERGNYKWTTEHQRDVLSKNLQVDKKARERAQETKRRKKAEGYIYSYSSQNHWTKTPEGRLKLSSQRRGKKFSDTAKHNMSLGAAKRVRTKKELHTSGNGGLRNDLECYFRSNWEANFARVLNFMGKTWAFEEYTFDLGKMTYTPDFYVFDDGCYYEIKGRMTEKSKEQLCKVHEMYPHIKIVVVEFTEYNQLKHKYKSLVNWEGA